MSFFYASEKNKRAENQDYYCHMEQRINHEAVVESFLIADGMGGMEEGRLYSRQAIKIWNQELLKVLLGDGFCDSSLLNQIKLLKEFSEDVFQVINQKLYRSGLDCGIRGGTTLSAAIHFWDTWIFANVGDSPIYYADETGFHLGSEIQNMAGKLLSEKKIERNSLLYYQNKNRLLEYLGRREGVHPHVRTLTDQKVKVMLMGSDGAFGQLHTDQLAGVLKQAGEAKKALDQLFATVREQGEEDNQTAILYLDDSISGSFADTLQAYGSEEKAPFGEIPGPEKEAPSGKDDRLKEVYSIRTVTDGVYVTVEEDEQALRITSRLFHLFKR